METAESLGAKSDREVKMGNVSLALSVLDGVPPLFFQ